MADDCVAKKNLGLVRCNKFPSMPKGMITTPPGFSLTPTEAADVAVWQAKLLLTPGTRIYLWPEFDKVEDLSSESTYDESPLSDLVADQGKYRWRFMISQNLCIHKAMFTHSGKGDRVFIWDSKNFLIGTEMTNGNLRGFKISLLNAEKLKIGDGSVGTYSPVYLVLKDHLELDKNGVMIDGDLVNELNAIVDVTLTLVGAMAADEFTVDVSLSCDESPLEGLVAGDFLLLNNAGAAMAKTVTPSTTVPGRYLIEATTVFVDGTVTLVPTDTLSVEAYEAENTLTLNVP